jgi:hypothetical protein
MLVPGLDPGIVPSIRVLGPLRLGDGGKINLNGDASRPFIDHLTRSAVVKAWMLGTSPRLSGSGRRASLSQPSWSAQADHPRVCLPQATCFGPFYRCSHKLSGREDVDARDKPTAVPLVGDARSLNRHGRAKSRPSTSGRATMLDMESGTTIVRPFVPPSAVIGNLPLRGGFLGSPRRRWPGLRPAMTAGRMSSLIPCPAPSPTTQRSLAQMLRRSLLNVNRTAVGQARA